MSAVRSLSGGKRTASRWVDSNVIFCVGQKQKLLLLVLGYDVPITKVGGSRVALRYDGRRPQMKSAGPQWVSLVLAMLALAMITYLATPAGVLKQATAFFETD